MISVIIPCKNEPYLDTVIFNLKAQLHHKDHEIKVQTEKGLGNAVICGIKNSSGKTVAVLDADGSHNPKYIQSMVNLLNKYDIVIGSRYIKNGCTEDYVVRRLISRIFCKIAKVVFSLNVNDTMSGYLVFKRSVFETINLNPIGYKIGLEIMVKTRNKFKIAEYPIVFEKRKIGYSKTGILQGIRTLVFIAKLYIVKR